MNKRSVLSKKFIIVLSVVVLFSLAGTVLLNNNIFLDTDYETEMSYEEKCGIFAPIIENNYHKMSKSGGYSDYGSEICKIYISTTDDNDVRKQILNKVQKLSDEICAGCQNDRDKVKAIAYWVSENIYYNNTAAETSVNSDTISLETTLELKATTCAGYSNIFSALCSMQDIYCLNLRGGSGWKENDPDWLLNCPMNHEWNAVLLDGEWVYVDTTWISPNTYDSDGYHKSENYNDEYFGMSAEYMSFEHRIDLIDHRDFKNALN